MNRAARIGLIILGVLLLVILVIAGIAVNAIRKPFPQTSGSITVSGLQAEVNIKRDQYGIPHIYAQNSHDLFMAQGYVHAQDRFWQMEFWRHVGQGRLAEMLGEPLVETDKFIRTMGWNRMAANTLAYYQKNEPEYYSYLEAYAAGVNAYIEANRDALSINYTILGLVGEPWEIEPWTPLDTVAWGVVMSDDLGGNWSDELRRARLNQEFGEEMVAELFPGYPYDDRPVIAPSDQLALPSGKRTGSAAPAAVDWQRVDTAIVGQRLPAGFGLGQGPFVGSNNWVVGGEHTSTGLPLLANDPHLGIQMPSIWYEVGLHAPGIEVAGFSFAGVPGVVIGHTDKIAWGFTNVGPDVQDLYIEKLNPDNQDQYEFEGEWRDIEHIQEVIKVNGGEDVVLDVRLTHHGPIINPVVDDPEKPEDDLKDVLAIRWTAQEPSRVLSAIMRLNQAQNYDDFRQAMSHFDVPAQNTVYADVAGNIAYQTPGFIPIRAKGDGLQPVPGWTGEYEWEGFVPYEEMPALFNPDSGFIVTANNAVVDQDYPYFISATWADGDRAQRIADLIGSIITQRPINSDDFARIQFDSLSKMAQTYVPLMTGLSSDDPQVQAALERLRGWDLQLRRDSVPATLFEIFRMYLAESILGDETHRSIEQDNIGEVTSSVFLRRIASQPDATWWDDITTPGRETQEEIILQALTRAVAWLEENRGKDMNDWTWGSLHTATFVSSPLGQSGVGPLEWLVNRGPFAADGGPSIVNANSWSWGNPASVTGHPSMRMIVDLSNLDASLAVNPTGQSGHPFNKHYDDMINLWLNGQYHPMLFSRDAVSTAAEDSLTLQP